MFSDIGYLVKRGIRVGQKEGPRKLLRDAIRELTPTDSGRLTTAVSDDVSPSWVTQNTTSIVRDETADYDDFYTICDSTSADEAYQISTSEPFDTVEFDIIGRSNTSEFTVTGELETESGTQITTQRQFNSISGRWDDYGTQSVSISVDEPLSTATLCLEATSDPIQGIRDRIYALQNRDVESVDGPRVSLPAVRSTNDAEKTPIVLVSVDTFRYDCLDCFDSLLDEMGEDAVVPDQPRTQAPETKSVHGTMFTGTYPADHGYVKRGGREYLRPINPSLTTLGELLYENRYKSSGLVTHSNLTADRGFARGFSRFQHRDMDWERRPYDAQTNVDTCLRWLNEDLQHDDKGLFYFMHLFDPHIPYFPPNPLRHSEMMDQSLTEELKSRNRINGAPPGSPVDYLQVYRNPKNPGDGFEIETVMNWYRKSLEFVSDQLARFVREMKNQDIYDDAFIIVTGDHGEEFFERKFAMHQTLYDATIRPGAIVKPPVDSDIVVPDQLDLLDIMPTIADLIGAEIPEQCAGKIWDGTAEDSVRIAERVWPDWYSIAAEKDEIKAIFTFDNDFPNRPTKAQRESGPVEAEFYRVDRVQAGNYDQISPNESIRSELRDAVLSLMESEVETTSKRVGKADQEVLDRLEELGYR